CWESAVTDEIRNRTPKAQRIVEPNRLVVITPPVLATRHSSLVRRDGLLSLRSALPSIIIDEFAAASTGKTQHNARKEPAARYAKWSGALYCRSASARRDQRRSQWSDAPEHLHTVGAATRRNRREPRALRADTDQ